MCNRKLLRVGGCCEVVMRDVIGCDAGAGGMIGSRSVNISPQA